MTDTVAAIVTRSEKFAVRYFSRRTKGSLVSAIVFSGG
jgi:hypothetical protein